MAKIEKDQEREYRIEMEIVVDAYDAEERAMGWYYYLQDTLQCPFTVRCIAKRAASPLRVGDEVEVLGMPSEDECLHEMFVTVQWKEEELAVPLSQLEVVHADDATQEAVEDWHYWVKQGYEF